MTDDKDQWLRDVAASAHGRQTGELMQILLDHRDSGLPSYEPLLVRVREVLVTRYALAQVDHLLGHLNMPRRDTMLKNTGNLPHEIAQPRRS